MEAIPAVGVNSAELVEALGFRHAISTANIHGAGDYLRGCEEQCSDATRKIECQSKPGSYHQ